MRSGGQADRHYQTAKLVTFFSPPEIAGQSRMAIFLEFIMVREGGPSTSFSRATDVNSWILRLRGG
jgi:hypothetical protein